MKRKLILLLTILTVLGSLPMNALASFALIVGSNADGNRIVTEIKYSVTHTGFALSSGFIEIQGSNLADVNVLFEKSGQGFVTMGERVLNTDTFVKYQFTKDETEAFIGKVRVGGQTINLNTSTFPNIQSSNKQTINVDDTPGYTIEFYGNNLDRINAGNVTGTYGAGISSASLGTNDSNLGRTLTMTDAINPGRLGYQNIILNERVTSADPTNGAPNVEIEYTYISSFRIIESLELTNLRMFPNTGAKGDEVYFRAENFTDTRNYQVYFLKTLDGSDRFTNINKATYVSLGIDVEGTEDVLTVKVPNDVSFDRRNYYVVITDELNNQVVAEQVVQRSGANEEYTVIESGYKPTIEAVYPAKGPDTGGNVQISGRNIATLNLPDLISTGAFKVNPVSESNEQVLVLEYADGTYKGDTVAIKRKVNVNIAKKTTFSKDTFGEYQVTKGIPDNIIVSTAIIDDAETDPFKDVVVEIETTITVTAGPNIGKKYIFNQIVSKLNGFEFEPSSYIPEITSMNPSMIQIEDTINNYSKFKNSTFIAIKGDKFLVNRIVDDSGNVIVRKPSILIKKNDDNTFNNRYQLGFFPNETYTGGGTTTYGIIKYKDDETGVEHVLVDTLGRAVPLEMTILTTAGLIVDGTSTNQIGQKIIIKVPSLTLIKDGGIKHLQVTNPTRGSTEFGKALIKSDFVEFVKTGDIPVIETVKPNIITVEGNEEIVVTGANFQEGIKIFLDGEPITTFTRDLDNTGNKLIITFKAPKGREGTTQLQLINPSGGLAVSDFTYVKTFNKAPILKDFSPKTGTAETMVVVNGDNFLKPDPTAATQVGIDVYRLVGTRIKIDGKEANDYNLNIYGNIEFLTYTVPNEEILIMQEVGNAVYSTFYENVNIVNAADQSKATLTNDAFNNPAISWNEKTYAIRYVAGNYVAYDESGQVIGNITLTYNAGLSQTTIAIMGGPTFTATMNNQLVNVNKTADGQYFTKLSDYSESIILTDGLEHYTLSYNFSQVPVLTNGKDKLFFLKADNVGNITAEDSIGFTKGISFNDNGLILDGVQLNMITAYIKNPVTGAIEGNRTSVVSKNQIIFNVPYLNTGKGYKNLDVINPDTKSVSATGILGFYYFAQSSSNPIISKIDPNKGSVDGGYFVTISGNDFEDDAKVYIDSVLVPSTDTFVALDGTSIKIKMPASIKNLNKDYGVDQMAVPVVVLNPDGGTDYKAKGFTYIIPQSDPVIESLINNTGSSNGAEIVEIIGYEFRYYEPYVNTLGGPGYDLGDKFTDIFDNNVWDDLFSPTLDPSAVKSIPELTNPYYDVYFESSILPKVYFGENEAKIVEYSKGYLKVITPSHSAGVVDVYVINNDSGVSNKLKYTYASSKPTISKINPSFGKKQGQEPKDIYGSKLYRSVIYGYVNNDATQTSALTNVQALVRFGALDNIKAERTDPDYGLINSQRTTVTVEGGLMVNYYGDLGEVKLTLTENNTIYTRTFNYQSGAVYVPLNMLNSVNGDYYVPYGLKNIDPKIFNSNPYEYVKLEIVDRRLVVERGYAPNVIYDSETHVVVYTPSYYSVGTVPMTFKNNDGGLVTVQFTYTNPASEPKIYNIEPRALSVDETKWLVESSVDGGIDIEITGLDFREKAVVYIGAINAVVKEIATKTINNVEYDLLIITVPKAAANDINVEYPLMIVNEDKGIASSTSLPDLLGPNYGANTIPYYFVYRKPLSDPRIDLIKPLKTSIFGGNTISLTGSDFRKEAYVIIGTRAGVPIYDTIINDKGTLLTFKTPMNMTLGKKTVQVLNKDYGIAIATEGIEVVSAPTLEQEIYDEKNLSINRVKVTGVQTITLRGTGFQKGAKVYFGGTYTKVVESDNIPITDQGVYKDDQRYYVKGGYLSPEVTVVDDKTMKVKIPQVDFEGVVSIVVMNPDNGITNNELNTEYTVPIPADPVGLKATIVNNTYIKLYDYTSEDTNYYEIYVYMGLKTDTALMNNNFSDFKYLGITNIEPYKISNLPGYDQLSEADRIVFVVKANNKFGASGFSNMAVLTGVQVKEIKVLGPPNVDGDLTVPEGKEYEIIQNGDQTNITLSAKKISAMLQIDAGQYVNALTKFKKVNIPESIVMSSTASVTVNFGKSVYRFAPVTLNTLTFKTIAQYYDAYATITEDITMNAARSYLRPNIRGKKALSDVYSIGFIASSNETAESFVALGQGMDFSLVYDDTYISMAQEAQIQLYKYNTTTNTYVLYPATLDRNLNRVTARLKEAGHYVLLTNY